jgi:uncharacterized protein
MIHEEIITRTVDYVRSTLLHAEGGHDWHHINRVWNTAREIASHESCDILVVELAALLHDIADSKFHGGDEEIGPKKAAEFLSSIDIDDSIISHVSEDHQKYIIQRRENRKVS